MLTAGERRQFPAQVGEFHLELGGAPEAGLGDGFHGLDVGATVADLVIAGEFDILEEDRRGFDEFTGFPEGQAGLGIEPEFAFEEADALFARIEFVDEDIAAVAGLLATELEAVVLGSDGDVLIGLAAPVHFGGHVAGDDVLLDGAVAFAVDDVVLDDAIGHHGLAGFEFGAFAHVGKAGDEAGGHGDAAGDVAFGDVEVAGERLIAGRGTRVGQFRRGRSPAVGTASADECGKQNQRYGKRSQNQTNSKVVSSK